MSALPEIKKLRDRMSGAIIGQQTVLDRLLIGLLANGNLLLEGLPGLAKTRAVKSMATHLEADFSRIQFTPDLLPSDITGTEVYYQSDGGGEFRFDPGPLFANVVLADEINRAPAKVQAALLEAMEERQITVAGTTHKLPPLFIVMATQNPIEQEGTYPLPEAQLDRFLMHVQIEYPDADDEVNVIQLVRSEEAAQAAATKKEGADEAGDESTLAQDVVFEARNEIFAIHVSDAVDRYIVDLIDATRFPAKYDEDLGRQIEVGASPRGGLALDRASRAHAWLEGRDHVTPDDIRAIAHDCLRHRVKLSYEANAAGASADDVIAALVKQVAVA
ncbi:MAG: AAA domain-containing protein [Acidobacteria bacterium]|nr:AAA domain-containing protein [Acidobacteriota bacterium]